MKYLVFISLFLLVGCASVPKPVYVDLSPAIANTTNAAKALNAALKDKSIALKNKAIEVAQSEIKQVQTQLFTESDLAKKIQAQRDFFMNADKEKDKVIADLKQKISHFNKLLFFLSSLIGLIAGFFVGRIAMAFSPYGLFIGIGAGASAFGASWALLSHL